MKGIKFGEYHSYRDLGLILAKKEIGSPEQKKKTVDIEGADSVIDYTEYFGEVKYENRMLKFDFVTYQNNFLKQYSDIVDALHGKQFNIILDEDSNYYYEGRISVSPLIQEKNIGFIAMECDCKPYKKKVTETVVSRAVEGTSIIVLPNSRQRVVPRITTTASLTIAFGEYSGTFSAGTFIIPELELHEGDNTITVSGTGNISFIYREGRL